MADELRDRRKKQAEELGRKHLALEE
eukprot:SAG31_NODE_12671_length_925_cov_1.553269_1_plen_25_part_10